MKKSCISVYSYSLDNDDIKDIIIEKEWFGKLKGTFEDWLAENVYEKLIWGLEEGAEGSDYVEYMTEYHGKTFVASYSRYDLFSILSYPFSIFIRRTKACAYESFCKLGFNKIGLTWSHAHVHLYSMQGNLVLAKTMWVGELDGTFEDWLSENVYGKLVWMPNKGREGTSYVEYDTSYHGQYISATYHRYRISLAHIFEPEAYKILAWGIYYSVIRAFGNLRNSVEHAFAI